MFSLKFNSNHYVIFVYICEWSFALGGLYFPFFFFFFLSFLILFLCASVSSCVCVLLSLSTSHRSHLQKSWSGWWEGSETQEGSIRVWWESLRLLINIDLRQTNHILISRLLSLLVTFSHHSAHWNRGYLHLDLLAYQVIVLVFALETISIRLGQMHGARSNVLYCARARVDARKGQTCTVLYCSQVQLLLCMGKDTWHRSS